MSENALDRKGKLGRFSTCPNQTLPFQCRRVEFYTPEHAVMLGCLCIALLREEGATHLQNGET